MQLGMMMVVTALATAILAGQAAAEEGQYGAALHRIISETAAARCPEDLMADTLLAACRQQLPQMSAGLVSLGDIEALEFLRSEDRPDGRVEIYQVRFASGRALNWGIGGFHDGKFRVAFATNA